MIVYDSNGQPYEADLVLGEQYRELEKENKRLENIFASGVHSCHENCQRPLCVLRRRAEQAEARVKELEELYRDLRVAYEQNANQCVQINRDLGLKKETAEWLNGATIQRKRAEQAEAALVNWRMPAPNS